MHLQIFNFDRMFIKDLYDIYFTALAVLCQVKYTLELITSLQTQSFLEASSLDEYKFQKHKKNSLM